MTTTHTTSSVMWPPQAVTDHAFAHGLMDPAPYLPPDGIQDDHWRAVARAVYADGLGTGSRCIPASGVDPEQAWRHVGALLRTPDTRLPDAQRDDAVAVCLAIWFRYVELENGPSAGQVA